MCLAIPGQVVELFPDQPTAALIDVVGVRRKVDLGLLQDDLPVKGDWVLIHVGFAMSKISEEDASTRCARCGCWERRKPPCKKLKGTDWKMLRTRKRREASQ